jgi:putative DNA primase/helicase
MAGDPGLGKTQVGLDIAARLSTGDRWPDGGVAPIGNSIIMSAEDGIGDTIVPRLEVAGADLSRVLCLKGTKSPDGTQSMFTLQRDLDELGKAIAQIGGAKYIMIDPVTAYMGKIDSHRTTDVRAVLAPLTEFAEAHNVAVLSITHPPKASQAKAIHAFTGSLAHVAAARMAFLVVEEEGTDRILFLHAKNNLAPPPDGLAFRKTQGTTAGGNIQSYVVWDGVPVTVTANEALQASSGREGPKLAEAREFLRDYLANGPVAQKVVQAAAEREGISSATLRRAKRVLRIESKKEGFDDDWTWSLPA